MTLTGIVHGAAPALPGDNHEMSRPPAHSAGPDPTSTAFQHGTTR
jgi:hypothetical protein